jgi:L-lactate utilization protein LutB
MPHPAKQWHYETLARRAMEALKANHFDAVYASDSPEATRIVLSLMPPGATVGFGTSMTLQAIGLADQLSTPSRKRWTGSPSVPVLPTPAASITTPPAP